MRLRFTGSAAGVKLRLNTKVFVHSQRRTTAELLKSRRMKEGKSANLRKMRERRFREGHGRALDFVRREAASGSRSGGPFVSLENGLCPAADKPLEVP